MEKTNLFRLIVFAFILLIGLSEIYSQTLQLKADSLVLESSTSFVFRISAKNLTSSAIDNNNSQFAFTFNNAILTGGTTPVFSIVTKNVTYSGNNPTVYPPASNANEMRLSAGFPTPGNSINPSSVFYLFVVRLTNAGGINTFINHSIRFKKTGSPYTRFYLTTGEVTTANILFTDLEDTPLPVDLASFTSNVSGRDVNLLWQTTKEINNDGFEIERKRIADNNWIKIDFVKSKGNSNNPVNYNFVDKKLNTGKYNYRLKQIDYNGNYQYFSLNNDIVINIPLKFDISQNYPNPFNPETKIDYQLPGDYLVKILIYDNTGREIITLINKQQEAGYYTISFNASNLSSGVYFYRIITRDYIATKKMLLVK
jgi:hypothetical protein